MLDLAMTGVQAIASGSQVPGDYARRRASGDSVGTAGLKTGSSFFSNTFLSVPGAIAVGAGVAMVAPAANMVNSYNSRMRQMGTPFSHRFDHSEMTSRLQNYGLSRIGAMGGLGNEASNMYGSFGR